MGLLGQGTSLGPPHFSAGRFSGWSFWERHETQHRGVSASSFRDGAIRLLNKREGGSRDFLGRERRLLSWQVFLRVSEKRKYAYLKTKRSQFNELHP